MHAYYEYSNGATSTDMLGDVVKILTGTTSVAVLSSSAIKTTTVITSIVPAGWVLYDNGGDPSSNVMLAANIDVSNFNGTQAQLDASVTAGRTSANSKFMLVSLIANVLSFRACESATTARVMVNECFRVNGDSNGQRMFPSSVGGGILRISASARHAVAFGNNQAKDAFSNSQTSYGPSGVFERTRRSIWDTNAAGYPVSVSMSGGGSGHIGARPSFPRIRGVSGVDITGANAIAPAASFSTGSTFYNGSDSSSISDPIRSTVKTVDGSFKHMLRPLWPGHPREAFAGGDISAFSDFWQFTPNIGNVGDTTVADGKTYEIWMSENSSGLGAGFRYVVRIG